MSTRIIKLLILTILIGLVVVYIWWLNPTMVSLNYPSGGSGELPLGVVMLICLAVGAIGTILAAAVIGLRYQFELTRQRRKNDALRRNEKLIEEAREQLACGNFPQAESCFNRIISRNPENLVARVMLTKTICRQGDVKRAIKVLDDARMEQKKNLEMLFLASELNARVGNYTAARDNMAMANQSDPGNAFALRRLVHYSSRLNRYEEALEYQRQLIRLLPADVQDKEQSRLAALELKQAEHANEGNPSLLKEAYEGILRRHKDFVPALTALARTEWQLRNPNEAAKLWSKAFKLEPRTELLEDIARMRLEDRDPDSALRDVKQLIFSKGFSISACPSCFVFYVALLLHLEMLEEAGRQIAELKQAGFEDAKANDMLELLDAALLRRLNRYEESSERMSKLLERVVSLPGRGLSTSKEKNAAASVLSTRSKEAPSPRLSTP